MNQSNRSNATDTLPLVLRVGGSWYWEQDDAFRFMDIAANVDEPNRMPSELVGMTRWEMTSLMPPEFWEQHRQDLQAHRAFHNLEYAVPASRTQKDSVRWICTSGEPRFDHTGSFVGYRGLSNDVTLQRHEREASLATERRFGDFVESLSDWLWETDTTLRYTWVSKRQLSPVLDERISLLGEHLTHFHRGPGTDLQAASAVDQAIAERRPFRDFVFCMSGAHGEVWVSKSGTPYWLANGEFGGYRGSNRDVTTRMLAERQLQERERRLAALFAQSPIATLECDTQLQVCAWNAAAERLFGWTAADMVGQDLHTLFHHLDQRAIRAIFANKILPSRQHQAMAHNLAKDGRALFCSWTTSVLHDEHGQVQGVISMVEDRTEHHDARQAADHMATHDSLTGLRNRAFLNTQLATALEQAGESGAVVLINLDRFKLINDSMGHLMGDHLLHLAAQRIIHAAPATAMVARLGADEFGLLLRDLPHTEDIWKLCEALQNSLRQPYEVEMRVIECTASMGVALYPEDGATPVALMQAADIAIDYAKSLGPDTVRGVTPALRVMANARRSLALDLRHAVRNNELLLHYQPQIDASTGRVCGVEALVRWQHPGLGMVPPAQFIPIAEETGTINEIGAWVLQQACCTLSQWRRLGLCELTMSVNLSARQLRHATLIPDLGALLQQFDLPGHALELELTESVAMADPEATIALLHAMRALGVQLAIDDFGTGYSSLGYLKLLPMNRLKIDRSFVKDMQTEPKDAAICSATIALAHTLGLTVVAEGVETTSQREQLNRYGCDTFQGYLFSKPLAATDALDYLLKNEQTMGARNFWYTSGYAEIPHRSRHPL